MDVKGGGEGDVEVWGRGELDVAGAVSGGCTVVAWGSKWHSSLNATESGGKTSVSQLLLRRVTDKNSSRQPASL